MGALSIVALGAWLTGSAAAASEAPPPRIAGEWIRIATPPVLERYHKPGVQTVDFTIFQAADDTWQLISCVRGTAAPGKGRLLYRWESARLTDSDWQPRGIFQEADPTRGMAEGRIQAPHVVREGDTWWLFCNSKGAHAMTSPDGKAFTWATNRQGASRFFDMPRDVMILDNRVIDQRWYAFFTDIRPGRYQERNNHTVSFRSTETLDGTWSDKVDVGVLIPADERDPRYTFAEAESPFVLRRGEWYYRWEQMSVYASRSLTDWRGATRTQLLKGRQHQFLAPEVVEDAGTFYLAAYRDHGKSGIFLVPLAWGD